MLPKSKWRQYGHPGNEAKGIIIHNTNYHGKSAEWIEKWMKVTETDKGCHFLVDHKEVRKVMPLNWSVYNVGNGMAFGNTDCIAIEICTNPSTKLYLEGEAKAIELIEELMAKYHLTKNEIFFHRDFDPNINCPAQILSLYGTKAKFLAKMKGDTE